MEVFGGDFFHFFVFHELFHFFFGREFGFVPFGVIDLHQFKNIKFVADLYRVGDLAFFHGEDFVIQRFSQLALVQPAEIAAVGCAGAFGKLGGV